AHLPNRPAGPGAGRLLASARARPGRFAAARAHHPGHPVRQSRRHAGHYRHAAERAGLLRSPQRRAAQPGGAAAGGERGIGAGRRRPAGAGALPGAHGLQRHPPLCQERDHRLPGARGHALRARRERHHLVRRNRLHAAAAHGQRGRAGHGAEHPGALGHRHLAGFGGDRGGARRGDRGVAPLAGRGGARFRPPVPLPVRRLALRRALAHRRPGDHPHLRPRDAAPILPPVVPPGADVGDRRGRLRRGRSGAQDPRRVRRHPRAGRAGAAGKPGAGAGQRPRDRHGGSRDQQHGPERQLVPPGAPGLVAPRLSRGPGGVDVRGDAGRPPERHQPAARRAVSGRGLVPGRVAAAGGNLCAERRRPAGRGGARAGRRAHRGAARGAPRLYPRGAGARKGGVPADVGADLRRAPQDHQRPVRGPVRRPLPARRPAADGGRRVGHAERVPARHYGGGRERGRPRLRGHARPHGAGHRARERRHGAPRRAQAGRRRRLGCPRPRYGLPRNGIGRAAHGRASGGGERGVGGVRSRGGHHPVDAEQRRAGGAEADGLPGRPGAVRRHQPRWAVAASRQPVPARPAGDRGGAGGRRGGAGADGAAAAAGGKGGQRGDHHRRAARDGERLRGAARRRNHVPAGSPVLYRAPPRHHRVGSLPPARARDAAQPRRHPGKRLRRHADGRAHAAPPARAALHRGHVRLAEPGPGAGHLPAALCRRGRLHLLPGRQLSAGQHPATGGALPGQPSRGRGARTLARCRHPSAREGGGKDGAPRRGAQGADHALLHGPGAVLPRGPVGDHQPGRRPGDPPARTAARAAGCDLRRVGERQRIARPRAAVRGGDRLQHRPRPAGRADARDVRRDRQPARPRRAGRRGAEGSRGAPAQQGNLAAPERRVADGADGVPAPGVGRAGDRRRPALGHPHPGTHPRRRQAVPEPPAVRAGVADAGTM
ncbi:MAG: hypothetical protein AVDCRST_MAG89-3473, partial [uncultured Gemmatimonadetes bacterium]